MNSVEHEFQINGIDYEVSADVSISWDNSYGAHPDLGGGRPVYEGTIESYNVRRFDEDLDAWQDCEMELPDYVREALIEKVLEN